MTTAQSLQKPDPIINQNNVTETTQNAIPEAEKIQPVVETIPARSNPSIKSGRHNTRSENPISADTLKQWLTDRNSPLAEHADTLARSPYYSTIIGICWIEQHQCKSAPAFNYWGLMGKAGLQKFPNMESGIAAIDAFLAKGEAKHPTIESMKGWYCASACTNWQPTVIKIKVEVENLK